MQIIGRTRPDGPVATAFTLGHGQDPHAELARRGFAVSSFDRAELSDGEIAVSALVRPSSMTSPAPTPIVRREAGLDPTVEPEVRQRIAAYAIVRSTCGVLATQFSSRTGAIGRWGLPGGGIDPGEEPTNAALREVCEETAQQVVLGEFWTVRSQHWIGASPDGRVEDYHAVRLIYLADCPSPTDPVVLDVGGTTEAARWVPVDRWRELDWASGSTELLEELLGPSTGSGTDIAD